MSWPRTLALLVVPAFVAASSAGEVLLVAPSGAPYAEIQAAVDDASDGDVVLVRDGTYASFAVRNVELAIVADAGATVQINGAVRVSGVGAARTLVLAGLHATGVISSVPTTRHGLTARNCAGALRLFDCEFRGALLPFNAAPCNEGAGAWVENCADVVFTGCSFSGTDGHTLPIFAAYGDGGHGVFADSATVACYDSTLSGGGSATGYGMTLGCYPPPDPAPHLHWGAAGEGLRAQGGFLFASNCSFQASDGHAGSCDPPFCDCAGPGANAVYHNGGTANVFLLGDMLVPGAGGSNPTQLCCQILCHNCVQECAGAVAPNGQAFAGGAFSLVNGVPRRLVATRVAREGQSVTSTCHGVAGDRVETRSVEFGALEGFHFEAALRGVPVTQLRHGPQLAHRMGTVGPSGVLAETWSVPDLGPNVRARLILTQAIAIASNGQATLSSPTMTLLLDSAL